MKLVLDTNILIAALIKKSISREILVHPDMEYLIPEFALEEIETNKEEILEKSKLTKGQLDLLLEQLKTNLTVILADEIKYKADARRLMDPIDPEDTIFIALALSTKNDGIWSQDKHFGRQNRINVWKTKDLIQHLGIKHVNRQTF